MVNNRENNAIIAINTLDIINAGFYKNKRNELIELKLDIEYSISKSILYKPSMFTHLEENVQKVLTEIQGKYNTTIEITNETTLHAAERLVNEGFNSVACLNFASAKNPGGGFLNGSSAQEESLARSSALYPCIAQMKEMYEFNMKNRTCLYSDYMIYSPNVPVFKDDKGELLDSLYKISFITAPAVNVGVVKQKESIENIKKISETMINRIDKILSLAVINNQETIVLGAYGCGVFKNDPSDVAIYFRKLLLENGKFKNVFKKVTFAILDKSDSKTVINCFKRNIR